MPKAIAETPPTQKELQLIDAYRRATNYLSVGQIYLLTHPMLKEPLSLQPIKPRLPGHGGTTSALNFIYVHLNRVSQMALNDRITHRMPA